MDLLTCNQISYGSTSSDGCLKNITISFRAGSCYILESDNPAASTLLLAIIGGIIPAESGRLLLQNRNIPRHRLASFRRRQVSYLRRTGNLLPHMTPYEHLRLHTKLPPLPVLGRLGISPKQAFRVSSQLTAEEQIRTAAAGAVASDSRILLIDRAFDCLDADPAARIWDQLNNFSKRLGKCIICSPGKHAGILSGSHLLRLDQGQLHLIPS